MDKVVKNGYPASLALSLKLNVKLGRLYAKHAKLNITGTPGVLIKARNH